MSIRAVGIIEPDQRRLAHIHTRVSGWVNKLYVDYVGQQVQKGSPLLEIYSPELLSSQSAYLIAKSGAGFRGSNTSTEEVVNSSKKRLELLGVVPRSLPSLIGQGKPEKHSCLDADRWTGARPQRT